MAYRKGEIILVPFPFTDLSAQKTRPAMVLSDGAFEQSVGSVVVAMITSIPHTTPFDYALTDWKSARLLHPSWVRYSGLQSQDHE
jgi:mRNA interferase MazF